MDGPILATYRARTPASRVAYAEACHVMPGGTSRQAGHWSPYPLTIARADGVHLWDLDGHRYLDLIFNYTSMVHGHAFPPVVEAVREVVGRGTGWPAGNEAQTRLAAQLIERVPSVDRVRFTNSGTEAGLLAFTIAQVVTGRQKLLMARYGYHGSLPEFEVGSFGRSGPRTLLATFDDLASFEAVLEDHTSEVAAVFLEPVLGSGGVRPGSPDFLAGVAQAARAAGALFVLDEVLTFRFGVGGVQGKLGLEPDLTTFGKVIGGGFPVGAVGGAEDLLTVFDPPDMRIFHTGTFNANPVTMTAGDIAVGALDAERIARMDALASRLKEGLIAAAARVGLALSISHYGSCLNLYFSPQVPHASPVRDDGATIAKFHLAALNRGLFMAPRGMIALSTATTADDVEEAIGLAELAMGDVAAELD